jgi:hypothetical protein
MAKDRDFYMDGWYDPGSDAGGFLQPAGFSPATTGILPDQAVVDALFAGTLDSKGVLYAPGMVSNRSEIYFNPDGSPFVLAGARGYNGPMAALTDNGDGFDGMRLQPNGNLGQVAHFAQASTPLERRSVFGRATHDLSDNLSAFVQANYSSVEVETTGGFPPAITVWSAPIPSDGRPQVPSALQTLLNSRFTPDPDGSGPGLPGAPGSAAAAPWTLFRVLDFLGGPVRPVSSTDAYQIMAGVEGAFTNRDWTWEAYVSSGQTDTTNFSLNLPSLQRYQYLVAQPNFGVGNFSLGRNYTINCPTGLPIFRTTDPAASCLEGIDSKGRSITELAQNIAEFNLQGKIADMGAGELRFAAASAHARTSSSSIRRRSTTTSRRSGMIGSLRLEQHERLPRGRRVLRRVAGPGYRALELELGYRRSDYDSAAGPSTPQDHVHVVGHG